MDSEVQEEIMILNVMRWDKTKEGGKKGTRVSFILSDKQSNSANFVGCPVIDQFYEDTNIFNKITDDYILTPLVANFSIKSNMNPLKATRILSRIENDNASCDLV